MIESLFNFIPGGSEWIIVIVAAGVLLFGAKKIPELAKTFGKAKGEYKKGEIEADKELKEWLDEGYLSGKPPNSSQKYDPNTGYYHNNLNK